MRNNQGKVAEQIRSILQNAKAFDSFKNVNVDVVSDDGSVIINSDNANHEVICAILEDRNFPEVSDGVQQGSIVVINRDNGEMVEI
jgi:hypothetical protein